MVKIKKVIAREILDSRGIPTVETTVVLSDGITATASCPSGTSVGSYEAVELRDNDPKRFGGMGVLKAVENINTIIGPRIEGIEANHQQEIDKLLIELDGTQNKGKLGANATLCVSMAVCKAAAQSSVLPLFLYIRQFVKKEDTALRIPTPCFNVINGGKHAGGNVDFQEFMIIPASSKSFDDSLQLGTAIYRGLGQTLLEGGYQTLVGHEGGYGPKLTKNTEALQLIQQAIQTTPFRLGYDIFFGIDVAANSFYKDKKYSLRDKNAELTTDELIAFYQELNTTFHLLYLEDPLSEDDWEGWAKLHQALAQNTILVGDDLTVTNPYRLQMALSKQVITGMVIKPNQIGTVIEAVAVVEIARLSGLKIVVSHRSGETNDNFIADFAVAVSADYVKFGAPARGERVAKYNRLLQIEHQLTAL